MTSKSFLELLLDKSSSTKPNKVSLYFFVMFFSKNKEYTDKTSEGLEILGHCTSRADLFKLPLRTFFARVKLFRVFLK